MPATTFGKETSRANSLKHGLTAGSTLVTPAQARSLPTYLALWLPLFGHLTHPDARRLLRDLALADLRIDQCQDADLAAQTLQADPVLAAEDANLAATLTFEQLDRHPERTVARLRQSSAGCKRLVRAWNALKLDLDSNPAWPGSGIGDDSDRTLRRLTNLLGRDPLEIDTDPDARLAQHAWRHPESRADLAALIARQIADLETLAQQIHDSEEAPRAALRAQGLDIAPSPDRLRLRRYESANRRLYHRCKAELEALADAEPTTPTASVTTALTLEATATIQPPPPTHQEPTTDNLEPFPTSFGASPRPNALSDDLDPLADLARHAIAIPPNRQRLAPAPVRR
jgi:hypothetical protein